MITFPDGFVATKYPGYFWNTADEKLYTMKVTGILRPMRMSYPAPQYECTQASYQVRVNGVRRRLTTDQIKRILVPNGTVPIVNP